MKSDSLVNIQIEKCDRLTYRLTDNGLLVLLVDMLSQQIAIKVFSWYSRVRALPSYIRLLPSIACFLSPFITANHDLLLSCLNLKYFNFEWFKRNFFIHQSWFESGFKLTHWLSQLYKVSASFYLCYIIFREGFKRKKFLDHQKNWCMCVGMIVYTIPFLIILLTCQFVGKIKYTI